MGEKKFPLLGLFKNILAARAANEGVARESVAYRIGSVVLSELNKKGLDIDRANVDEMARLAAEMIGLVLEMSEAVQAAVSKLIELAKEQEFIKGVYLVSSGSPADSAAVMLPVPKEKWFDAAELLGTWALEISEMNSGVAELVHNAREVTFAEWDGIRERSSVLPLWERIENTSEK